MSRITKAKETQSKQHTHLCKQHGNVKNHHAQNIPAILHLCRNLGNQAILSLGNSGIIQRKLIVGSSNDKYEQEADRIAKMVIRMPGSNQQNVIQRKEDKKEKDPAKRLVDSITTVVQLHTAPTSEGPSITPDTEKNIRSLKGNGRPLSKRERNFFEPRFGEDFSDVRIHTSNGAQKTATNLNAQAYTIGKNIVFGKGKYVPDSENGKKLLGHELVHVVQQNSNSKQEIINPRIEQNTVRCKGDKNITPEMALNILLHKDLERAINRCEFDIKQMTKQILLKFSQTERLGKELQAELAEMETSTYLASIGWISAIPGGLVPSVIADLIVIYTTGDEKLSYDKSLFLTFKIGIEMGGEKSFELLVAKEVLNPIRQFLFKKCAEAFGPVVACIIWAYKIDKVFVIDEHIRKKTIEIKAYLDEIEELMLNVVGKQQELTYLKDFLLGHPRYKWDTTSREIYNFFLAIFDTME